MMEKLKAIVAIEIAESYMNDAEMASSAKVGVEDAKSLLKRDQYECAIRRSIHSIEYSLGRFSLIWYFMKEKLDVSPPDPKTYGTNKQVFRFH